MPPAIKRKRKLHGKSKRSARESRNQLVERLRLLPVEEAAHEIQLFLSHKDIKPVLAHLGYSTPQEAAAYKHIVEESVGPGIRALSKRGGQSKQAIQQQQTGYTLLAGTACADVQQGT
jgi:AraC-like DNA-binding protein